MQLRPYQQEAVDAVYRFLCENAELNPCVVAPTGAGKSVIIAQLVMDVVMRWDGRVLLLAHVKELLEQNAEKIQALCPTLDIGLHSAGLGRYDTKNAAIVAGIQSVYRKAELLGRFDLVIVDEAHLISPSGDGMYRTLLAKLKTLNPQLRIVGLTATPYRLDGGLICKPENFLNTICYDIKVTYLIEQGYISRLVSQEGVAETDFSAFHLRGGEFVNEEAIFAAAVPLGVVSEAEESSDFTSKSDILRVSSSKSEFSGLCLMKDYKAVDYLTPFQSRIFGLLSGNTKECDISMSSGGEDYEIRLRPKSKAVFTVSQGGEADTVKLAASFAAEIISSGGDLSEQEIEEYLSREVYSLFLSAQKADCDIFGAGNCIRRKCRTIREWESIDWEKRFKDAYFSPDIKVVAERSNSGTM